MKLVRHELAGKFRISREYIKWKSQAATMTPADFLKKALPFGKGGAHGPAVEKYRKAIRSGEKIDAPQLFVNRARGGGFNHPANFKVTGHEGRHRMVAAQQEGITKVPVEIVAYQEPRFPDRSPALRKAMKMPRHFKPENKESRFARIDRGRLEMSSRRQEPLPIGYEAGIPLTGRVPRDRWVKKIRDEDLDRRDANLLRAGVAGAVGGALLRKSYRPGKLIPSGAKVGPARAYLRAMPTGSAAGFGAAAGIAGVLGIRQLTKHRRDPYGERQRGDKKAESVPALAGIGAAGYGAYKILRKKFKMSDGRKVTELAEMSAAQWKKATARMPDDPRQKAAAKWLKKQGHNSYVNWGWTDGVHKTYSKKYKTEGDRLLIHEEDGKLNVRRAGDDKLVASFSSIEFAEKKKKEINPYLTAGLSGAASGAGLGGLALLRRGVGLGGALKTGALGALFTGGVVGGGSIVGSKIVGEPKPKERAPFAIRSAVGGAIVGTAAGAAGGLLMRRVPKINRKIAGLANEWRPANWLTKSGSLKATGVGAVAGGGYGAFTGADEGQQVDTIRNLRKDIRKMSATSRTIELAGCCNSCMKQRIQRSTEFIKSKLKNKVKMQSTSETIELEKPFHGYNKKRHAKTGGLNDSYRKEYNREHGSNLKRPVTTEPSKLKPGSKSAKRRASFCARMGGMPGQTSKDGKLTPKGAALKRWNCSSEQKLVEFGIAAGARKMGIKVPRAPKSARRPIGDRIRNSKAGQWWRGEKLSGLQQILQDTAEYTHGANSPVAERMRGAFRADNKSRNRLVIGAGVIPPLATAAIGVGATYHSASPRWQAKQKARHEFGIAGRALQKSLFIGKAKPPIRLPYSKGETINPLVDNITHPTKQAMLVDMRKTQPTWNRGLKNKLRNFVEDYLMSDKSQPLEFQLTEEQRQLRNAALIAGGVAVPVGTAAYLGIRSIKKANAANEAMYKSAVAGGARPADVLGKYVTGKDRKVARGTPLALPPSEFAKQSLRKRGLGENGPAISKVDRYRRIAAERATLTSRRGQISLPLGSKLRGELIMRKSADRGRMRAGRQLRTDRSSALRPIIKDSLPEGRKSVPVGSSKVTLKSGAVGQVEHAPLMSSERMISTGKNLQEGIRNPALHSRGERKNMIAALALLRRKFKFASNQPTHAFDIWVRNERTGRASGFKDYVRGEDLVDREGRAATVTLPTFISSARREAEKGFRTARRTARLGKDVTEVVQGRKTKKREWEKGYFQKAVAVAALTGGLAAHGLVMRRALRPNAPKWVSGYSDSVKGATKYVVDQKNKMRDSVTKSVGLMSARLNHTIVLFEDKPKSTWKKAAGVAAGLGTAALGASMLPAAYKMAKIQIRHGGNVAKRKVFKSPKSDPYNGGRFVSDYLDASQAALNSGIHGKVIGKVLQTAKQKPGGMTAAVLRKTGVAGDDFKVSHYARFRAGQKEALGHWDWEVGQRIKSTSGHARMAKRRDAAQKEIQDRLYNYGQNEKEAIRHVATSTRNKDVRDYFDQLAAHKKGAAKMYARRLALAPVAVVGGAGVAAASSRKEFSYYNADMEGWDLRDARGRSARVFAPNSKRRVRRESKWHERKRNQRNLLIGGGLVAAIGTGAGALAIGGAGRAKAVSAVKNRMMGMINRVRRNRSIRPKPSKEWQPTLLPAATA